VEEPIAEEAAAYEEAKEVVEEDQGESSEQAASEESAEVADEPEIETNKGPVYVAPPEDDEIHMDWYILKVQSNRERSIAEALERKLAIEGLSKYCDHITVPTEKVTEFK